MGDVCDPGSSLRGMLRCIDADMRIVHGFFHPTDRRMGWLRRLDVALMPGVQCCAFYRLSHWLHVFGLRFLASVTSVLARVVYKAHLHPSSSIGPGIFMPHPVGVCFAGIAGERLILLPRAVVSAASSDPQALPCLGDDILIGSNAVVTGRLSVGSRTIISTNVVVVRDVPEDSVLIDRRLHRIHPQGRL
jgi:serine O-acetyltransferase